jgi:predicted nuclease of restriction endonuclease-like (RecB) superfamily
MRDASERATLAVDRESLKGRCRFGFLALTDEAQEREIENALVEHVTAFLLELGAGFAFVGRQVLLDVGGDEFFRLEHRRIGAAIADSALTLTTCVRRPTKPFETARG